MIDYNCFFILYTLTTPADKDVPLTFSFTSSSPDLQKNAPGDYRFINGGEVRGESFFAAVVLRRNAGKTLLCPSLSI